MFQVFGCLSRNPGAGFAGQALISAPCGKIGPMTRAIEAGVQPVNFTKLRRKRYFCKKLSKTALYATL